MIKLTKPDFNIGEILGRCATSTNNIMKKEKLLAAISDITKNQEQFDNIMEEKLNCMFPKCDIEQHGLTPKYMGDLYTNTFAKKNC